MLEIIRTNSKHKGFQHLVALLDTTLAITDGDEHAFYDQYNSIESINHVVVLTINNIAVACGALKVQEEMSSVEIKRMFTVNKHRGKGLASIVLNELETWALELNYKKCILETGKRQTQAIRLYEKNNYEIIENYGQYAGMDNSVCFRKELL